MDFFHCKHRARRGTSHLCCTSLNAEPKMHQRHAKVHQLETNNPPRQIWHHLVFLWHQHIKPHDSKYLITL